MQATMMTKRILTFSRRTDPAFYMDWYLDKLNRGECWAPNPFSGKPYRVSLRPEDVQAMTFWTKEPRAVAAGAAETLKRGIPAACFVTVTGYPRWLERNVPPADSVRDGVDELAIQLGSRAVWWRYDPVIMTSRLTADWHCENFSRLCRDVWAGRTGRVIISLAHIDGPYAFARKAIERACEAEGDPLAMPSYGEFISCAANLQNIAREYGISLEVCCSPKIREGDGNIRQGRCLDPEYLAQVAGGPFNPKKGAQRKGSAELGYAPCCCIDSRDIGSYGTCPHACVYCYARRGESASKPTHIAPGSPWLCDRPFPGWTM